MEQKTGVETSVWAEASVPRLSANAESRIYRVARAALTNAAGAGRAGLVHITVAAVDGGISVVIEDDGVGFDVGAVLGGPHRGSVRPRRHAGATAAARWECRDQLDTGARNRRRDTRAGAWRHARRDRRRVERTLPRHPLDPTCALAVRRDTIAPAGRQERRVPSAGARRCPRTSRLTRPTDPASSC